VQNAENIAGLNTAGLKEAENEAVESLTQRATDKGVNTGTLGKALEVLDVIALSPTPMRFTDILNELDQPRGTLHRQISNLVEENLVEINANGSYTPGVRLLKLAARAWSQNSFRTIAEPHVRALHETTGETVHLGILNGLEVIYVDKLESKQAVRMHSQVGNASPLYCTGIGKAILALLDDETCRSTIARFNFQRHTQHTLYTPALLLEDIVRIRESGTAQDREEHEPGIRCVAAGIGCSELGTIAGISVTAPAFRIKEETISSWEKLVKQSASAIEREMNARMGPRSQE